MAASREGSVRSVRFEAAKGGIISHTEKAYARGGQGGGPLEDIEHKPEVHPTMEHAKAHLEATMGHCFGEGSKEKEEKPEE